MEIPQAFSFSRVALLAAGGGGGDSSSSLRSTTSTFSGLGLGAGGRLGAAATGCVTGLIGRAAPGCPGRGPPGLIPGLTPRTDDCPGLTGLMPGGGGPRGLMPLGPGAPGLIGILGLTPGLGPPRILIMPPLPLTGLIPGPDGAGDCRLWDTTGEVCC